jgi:CRP-like cAMP-binding protein
VTSKLFKKVVRKYTTGEVIFHQGSLCDGIYSVQSGLVSVYKTKPSPKGPVDIELVKLGPGSMFGEMGMLDNTTRDASVKALEFTEVIVITRAMFETQMSSLPPWIVNFIKILNSRLRITNDKLTSAMQLMEANGVKLPEPAQKTSTITTEPATPEPTGTPAEAALGDEAPVI